MIIKIIYRNSKMTKFLFLLLIVFGASMASTVQSYGTKNVYAIDSLYTYQYSAKSMIVKITHTDIIVYKLDGNHNYNIINKISICQVSQFLVIKPGQVNSHDLDNSLYHAFIGCKNGYFQVYNISLETNNIVKVFQKNVGSPINKLLIAFPYLLVANSNKIYLFNFANQKIDLEITIMGPLNKLIYVEERQIIQVYDKISQININLSKFVGLQVNRKSLPILKNKTGTLLNSRRLLKDDNNTINNGTQDGVCGNNIINKQQQCDDGNTIDGDGCNSICKLQSCGDSIVNNNGTQQCDDGNSVDGDGCTDCKLDCGDGKIEKKAGEQCDDGNKLNGDGCSQNCLKQQQIKAYPAGLGVGLGIGAVALAGTMVGSAAAPAAAGVASSLVGTQPVSLMAGQLSTQIAGQAGGQAAGQAVNHMGQAGNHLGQGLHLWKP